MTTVKPDENSVSYVCSNCLYTNVWTRDQILQKGKRELFRGDKEDIYSLKCKNPEINCPQRMEVAVERTGR